MAERVENKNLLAWTTRIVAAYIGRSSTTTGELAALIAGVHHRLSLLSGEPHDAALLPAVPVRRSLTPDYIVCLEDGKKLKMLRRHLKTTYQMSPEDYRKRWGLPADYPMVAPNYARRRSALAKKIGLGKRGRSPAVPRDAARQAAASQ